MAEAYLYDGAQCVRIDDVCSDPVPVKSSSMLYVDDCTVYHNIQNPSDQALLNNALAQIAVWCTDWQMKINIKKSVAMTVTQNDSH